MEGEPHARSQCNPVNHVKLILNKDDAADGRLRGANGNTWEVKFGYRRSDKWYVSGVVRWWVVSGTLLSGWGMVGWKVVKVRM